MFKNFFKRIKRIWCSLKCCFESKCNIEAKDNNGDGIPDEVKFSN